MGVTGVTVRGRPVRSSLALRSLELGTEECGCGYLEEAERLGRKFPGVVRKVRRKESLG